MATDQMDQLVGASPALAAVREELSRLLSRSGSSARLPAVLIQGETGTGKGLVAHVIHQMGPRAKAAFVDVNCAAIPDTLLEAELFGFERGAFTDARQAKPGLLHVAHRGTIFLDEIGLMPDAVQAKLLKALEDRSVRRLGSTRHEPADAWVLAATSENLSEAVRERRFREDLYHRLAVFTLRLPALRERGDDVVLLARHYLKRACADYGLPSKTLTPEAEQALMAYDWPGNVRELANVMERVALLSDLSLVPADLLRLPETDRRTAGQPRAAASVDEQTATLERARIAEALRIEGWNISRTAARLGLPRNTLRYRMVRHGLTETGETAKHRRRSEPQGQADAARPPVPVGSASQVRWQRTRLTLLQADVIDAAEWIPDHERTRAIEDLAAKASGFGGRILDLTASSVRAAFGLETIEDAASHAALAALAMRSAFSTRRSSLPQPLKLSIALHTDELLVGRLDDRVELDADGRRAAQEVLDSLINAASSEDIVTSAATKPFLERRFEVEPLGGGLPASWRITSLLDADVHATPFVSRASDLALLDNLLTQVENGRGQAALLIGDPGIGKSRLLHEFRLRIGHRAAWLEGSALSFGHSLPLHPLIHLLKNAFAIRAEDPDHIVSERVDDAGAAFGDKLGPSVPFLRALLSVDPRDPALAQLDPKLRRAGMFDAIRQFVHLMAEVRPLVMVLEDVHWMDQATGEFLALMVESLLTDRVLLCVTHRTGYALPFASAFGTRLTLAPVSAAETGAIGRSVLGAAALAPELQQLVNDKAEGNPFFVEEVLRSLQERGALERRGDEIGLAGPTRSIDIPDSVQDVILVRLERLDPAARELLHVAAVIGREFPRRVLERVMPDARPPLDDRIQALRAADLIHSARIWPEIVYVFKHALTQDVAYHSQAEAQRRLQHARIGEAVEQVYADRLSEHHGVLAHHFRSARRWDKAVEHLLAAAQQAERTFATREALALYDEARVAAEHLAGGVGDPDTLIRIFEAKARLYFVTSEFRRSAEEGERILPLARLTGNRAKEAEALATLAWAATWGRNLDAALRFGREALAVAEPAGALAVQGRAHFTIGFVQGVTGDLDEGHAAVEKAMAISAAAGDSVYRSLSLSTAGLLRNWKGDYDEAARLQDEGLTIARERGLLVPLLFSCFLRGLTLTGQGRYDDAMATFTEGLSLAERVGDEAIHHRLLNCLGWLYADIGDLDQAETLNARSAQIGRRRNDPGTQPNAELNLGDILKARGELTLAQEQYDSVFRYWRNPSSSLWMRFRYSIRMFASLGELALARGDLNAARAHTAECLQLASRTGARKNLVKGWRLSGEIAQAERDWPAAERYLNAARDLAATLGNPVQRWKTEMALGLFLRDAGRAEESLRAYQQAASTMRHVRDDLRDETLRRAFDKNPDLQVVRALIAPV